MTDFQRIQIRLAANGLISGTLRDWPALLQTMLELGAIVDERTTAAVAKEVCRQLLMNEDR